MTAEKKEEVLRLFNGKLRIVIATTAFGLGIDCPDIRRIIHWGSPRTLEEYAQETAAMAAINYIKEKLNWKGWSVTAPHLQQLFIRGVGGENAGSKIP